jgi:hypothetical protein
MPSFPFPQELDAPSNYGGGVKIVPILNIIFRIVWLYPFNAKKLMPGFGCLKSKNANNYIGNSNYSTKKLLIYIKQCEINIWSYGLIK